MRVLEKAGFEFEGVMKKAFKKNGQFFDAHLYAKGDIGAIMRTSQSKSPEQTFLFLGFFVYKCRKLAIKSKYPLLVYNSI